jgi:hypothetical protein
LTQSVLQLVEKVPVPGRTLILPKGSAVAGTFYHGRVREGRGFVVFVLATDESRFV